MPEPLLYLKAVVAATIVSTMCVLAVRRPVGTTWLNSACVFGMGLGLASGCYVLSLRVAWPPVNGLDRFLAIVIPTALVIELVAGFQCLPRWIAWLLRMSWAAMVPRILLHGSVHLSASDGGWALSQAITVLAGCGGLLAGVWGLLSWLSQRSPGVSIPFALCLTTQCAGMSVMMAGYIKGGAAAFPLAASLGATTIAAALIIRRSDTPTNLRAPAILGVGVLGLFGLLCIGFFFGRLPIGRTLTMQLAPLLCFATEAPLLRHQKPWLVGSLRLVLVAIPLVVVLIMAKRDFDVDMAPLLGKTPTSMVRMHTRH